ncbi:MAG: hypothetical protein AAF560_31045, partial [Acidobacteriota bacterium]
MIDAQQTRTVTLALVLAAILSAPTQAGIEVWTSNGPYGGSIHALVVDPTNPQTLYAGTLGLGVFRSDDGGASWRASADSRLAEFAVEALAVSPGAPDTVFAGTQGGLFRSSDGGESWELLTNGISGLVRASAIAVDPTDPNRVYAGIENDPLFGAGGIYRSEDGGDSWSRFDEGLPEINSFFALAIDPQTPTTLYASTIGTLYKSVDSGEQWQRSDTGLDGRVADLAIDPTTPQTLYAAASNGVFKSTDGGDQWTACNAGLTALDVRTVVIDPSDPSKLLAGTFGGGVFATSDSCGQWSNLSEGLGEPAFIAALAASAQEQTVFYAGATPGGVYQLDGAAWSVSNSGLNNSFVRDLMADPRAPLTLYAATNEGVFKSTDGSASWQAKSDGFADPTPFIRSLAIAPAAPDTLYAAAIEGVYRTLDGGESWIQTSANPEIGLIIELVVDPFDAATLYATTEQDLYRSIDGGVSWQPRSEGTTGIFFQSLVIDPTDSSILYVKTTDQLFKSVDGALSWSPANNGIDVRDPISNLTIDPSNPSTLYFGSSRGGFFRSTDGADSWTFIDGIDTNSFIVRLLVDPRSPDTLYAGTNDGVYRSTNGGERWRQLGDGPANRFISRLVLDTSAGTKLYAGTFGGGVYDFQSVSGTTLMELQGGRFHVEVIWRDFGYQSDRGTVSVVSGGTGGEVELRSNDSTVVSFFEPDNWEMLAKVLDGRAINRRFWVFLAAATDVELTTTVTDTSCGTVATY